MVAGTEALLLFFAVFWGFSFPPLGGYRLFETHLLGKRGAGCGKAWKRFGIGVFFMNAVPVALVWGLLAILNGRVGLWAVVAAAVGSLTMFGIRRVIHALVASDNTVAAFYARGQEPERATQLSNEHQNGLWQHLIPGLLYVGLPVLFCWLFAQLATPR